MARRRKKPPQLRRRSAKRDPKYRIFVCCEGVKTECQYLRDFVSDYGNGLVRIKIVRSGMDPVRLVEAAIDVKEREARRTRRSGNSFDKNFKVAAVFDHDERPVTRTARERAEANKLLVGLSNPCIELWALLHYGEETGALSSADAQAKLHRVMPSYKHDSSPAFDYSSIRDKYSQACERADRCLVQREEEGEPLGNPSTTLHKVLRHIVANGKGKGKP